MVVVILVGAASAASAAAGGNPWTVLGEELWRQRTHLLAAHCLTVLFLTNQFIAGPYPPYGVTITRARRDLQPLVHW